jgi:glucose/arabinose dehydrogenase
MKRRNWLLLAMSLFIIAVLVFAGLVWWNFQAKRAADDLPATEVIATNLEIPWSLEFLPDGGIILTERPGRVRLIDAGGALREEPLLEIEEVAPRGEGGLLGIVLHPDFEENGYVYIYYTYQDGEALKNEVVRYRKDDMSLVEPATIIDGIHGASIHNGGRIKFGPDGFLYITTGDASESGLAQEVDSLAGKILRLKDDGSLPEDNPFENSPVYSYGHRNPQGLAWDGQERLWATEHGSSARDEVNQIVPGANYGWPVIRGDESAQGMRQPVIHSGEVTWAPSGAAVQDGSLYFAGLRSQSLWRLRLDEEGLTLDRYLEGKYGRIRTVATGKDGMLYICTSNRDGRAVPAADDDQVIRIDPSKLE